LAQPLTPDRENPSGKPVPISQIDHNVGEPGDEIGCSILPSILRKAWEHKPKWTTVLVPKKNNPGE